jgi:DNA mismatch endonuclease (patch repair protein)
MDSLTPGRRSALMKRVKRTDTRPELTLRQALHRMGFRYVIGDRRLPGTPDLVFPKHKAAVFVHGCFWHGHDCRQGAAPSSNVDYWVPKIEANRARDSRKEQAVRDLGWRVFTVWECELKTDRKAKTIETLASKLTGAANTRLHTSGHDALKPKGIGLPVIYICNAQEERDGEVQPRVC